VNSGRGYPFPVGSSRRWGIGGNSLIMLETEILIGSCSPSGLNLEKNVFPRRGTTERDGDGENWTNLAGVNQSGRSPPKPGRSVKTTRGKNKKRARFPRSFVWLRGGGASGPHGQLGRRTVSRHGFL
jgi:hypothetical protein